MSARPSGSRKLRIAEVRFYVDADILGLAKLLVQVRNDVTYPGFAGGELRKRAMPACPITKTATLDTDWIPVVAARNWLIITRDSRIQDNRAEIEAVRSNGARMIALAGRDARGTGEQLEVVMSQWRKIEATLAEPGPFIYSATRTALRSVALD